MYTKLKDDMSFKEFIKITEKFNYFREKCIPLCAAENCMSEFSKIPLSSYVKEKYLMGSSLTYIEDDNFIYPPIGGKIEKKVVKDTISPKSFSKEKVEKIIFPYYYNKNNDLVRYDTQEFEREFPNTCEYLKKFEKKLQNRKSDKNAKWFEYGRSQALKNSNNEKLLLSTVITDRVKTKILPKDNIPYSGIYIIPIKDKTLKEAEEILKSKEFFEYIEGKGINASGNSLRITAKDINEYMF